MNLRLLAVHEPSVFRTLFLLVAFALLLLPLHPRSIFGETTVKTGRKVVVRVDPEYPEFFRKGHFQGRVVAEATVLPNGDVSTVEIKGGNPMFANFAAKALKKWKYAPGPAQTIEEVNFNFASGSQ
ncbi:MAG TPA: energy transducer TonB [Candidatus Sulfotelmatobacter sp.]|nr:energy transducer TonB [Candidatus Sulfotelmatobacter sp.]